YGRGRNKHNNQSNVESSQKPELPPIPHYPWPDNPRFAPRENSQESDYDKGFSAGLKAKESGSGIDFVGFSYGGWSDDYKKGYMAAFGTTYTPS
ncbi:hypothetical protein WH79_08755, partial [Streptococcus dysgalactiae subsp. equisimilis]